MKKVLTVLIAALAAVACVYLTRFEFEFSQPRGNGEYQFRFKLRK